MYGEALRVEGLNPAVLQYINELETSYKQQLQE
jgi:hypothetical protein